jgi:CRP/FNR family cyclic AMP-dependent transcriptional regulator
MHPKSKRPRQADTFIQASGPGRRLATFERKAVIFRQGDPADSVMQIRAGEIQLLVLSRDGKEAILGTLGAGDFVGEGAVSGHPVRLQTARAATATTLLVISKAQMRRLLNTERHFSDRFIAHMLQRNARLEADLVDQLFNSSERRLARTLLLLARYGTASAKPQRLLLNVTQEALAEMVGTTRSRVNFFLNKFRKLGFIRYDAKGISVHPSLLAVIVHE